MRTSRIPRRSRADRKRKVLTLFSLSQIRQTARTGDTLRAWRMFEAAGWLNSDEADALSLRGRLLKDRALRSAGEDRTRYFDEAEAAYMRAAGDRRATYPLINAATIAFLNGKPERAQMLAQQTLAVLESGDYEPETAYWLGATRAEALLLLGDIPGGVTALEAAVARAPQAWEDHAATIRQLQLILQQANAANDLFDHLRPPVCLHFSGIIHLPVQEDGIRDVVEAMLDQIRPGFAFGALAAGSDILIGEMVLARGARLHVVLPGPVDLFRESSVIPFGDQWARRFDTLIEAADAVETLGGVTRLSDAAVTLAEEMAMGLAIRHAHSLASKAVALRLRRSTDQVKASEAVWRRRGLPVYDLAIDRESPASMLATLDTGRRRAILASTEAFPADLERTAGNRPRFVQDVWLMDFDDLGHAIEIATTFLRSAPENSLGLVYHVVDRKDDDEQELAEIASLLACRAPQGTICAAAPGAFALDLCAPGHHFEAAGELVTQFGDIPIRLFSLSGAA
ncbi:TRAFs-binding domain-containing protein [Sphingobium lignivorans]